MKNITDYLEAAQVNAMEDCTRARNDVRIS